MWCGIVLLVFVALPLFLLSLKDPHNQRAWFAGIFAVLALILMLL